MRKIALFIALLLTPVGLLVAESKLSKCQGENYNKWDNCYGYFKFPRGSYEGEWKMET